MPRLKSTFPRSSCEQRYRPSVPLTPENRSAPVSRKRSRTSSVSADISPLQAQPGSRTSMRPSRSSRTSKTCVQCYGSSTAWRICLLSARGELALGPEYRRVADSSLEDHAKDVVGLVYSEGDHTLYRHVGEAELRRGFMNTLSVRTPLLVNGRSPSSLFMSKKVQAVVLKKTKDLSIPTSADRVERMLVRGVSWTPGRG